MYMKPYAYCLCLLTTTAFFSCRLERLPEPICAKPPEAAFTPELTDCEIPCTVPFLNTSANAVSYQWNFGDGDSSSLEKPEHTFNKPGTYNVRLIALGTGNCTDTSYRTILVTGGLLPPVADFSPNITECTVGCIVKFTNKSQNANSFAWDFGDGSPLLVNPANIHPTHRYDCSGRFRVILTATSIGITVRDTQEIYIRTEQFHRTYDMSGGADGLIRAFPTPDGGYLGVGNSQSDDWHSKDGVIGKWDNKGVKIWVKSYDRYAKRDEFRDALLLPDGGLIAIGYEVTADGRTFGRMLRINGSGDTLWTKTNIPEVALVSKLQNEVFYVVFTKPDFGGTAINLFRYDIRGNEKWKKERIKTGLNVVLRAIAILPDEGVAVTGFVGIEASERDIFVAKFNALGDRTWEDKVIGGKGLDTGVSIEPTRDGGLIIGAHGNKDENSDLSDFYLLKLNASGTKEWGGAYKQENSPLYQSWPAQVVETKNGDFFFNGSFKDYRSGNQDAILLKVDKSGKKIWQKTLIGGDGFNYLNCLYPVSADCGFMMGGGKGKGSSTSSEFLLIKTDSDGNIR